MKGKGEALRYGILLVLVGILVHLYLTWDLRRDLRQEQSERLSQEESLQIAMGRNEELMSSCAGVRRRAKLSEQTLRHVRSMLEGCSAPLHQLDPKLELYRLILDPEQPQTLAVFTTELQPGAGDREWMYRLVLYQPRRQKEIRGSYDLVIRGTRAGREESVLLSKLDTGKDRDFAFRYFVNLEGTFVSPDGLEPEHLTVRISVDDDDGLEKQYSWEELLDPGSNLS